MVRRPKVAWQASRGVLTMMAAAALAAACSSTTGECDCARETQPHGTGARCLWGGDCSAELTCKADFAGELRVCTKACLTNEDCEGLDCVGQIPDYNGSPLGSFCMRPCVSNHDCAAFGSIGDDKGQG